MRIISSAAFRKGYPTLREPVIVTANGHSIGTYVPFGMEAIIQMPEENEAELPEVVGILVQPSYAPRKPEKEADIRRQAQAERDAILRRVQKG